MTTSLVPAVVETAIKPKPTKDEILTALATLHIENIKKENEERAIKHQAAEEKLQRLLVALAKKSGTLTEPSVSWSDWDGPRAHVNYTFRKDALSPEILALMKIYKETERLCVPCMSEARKQVRVGMGELVSKSERVNALLTDKGSRAALEAALQKIAA